MYFIKLIQKLILPVLLVFFTAEAMAQTKVVSGRVTDAAGSGLPGVTVAARGTNIATSTGNDGTFSLTVPANTTTLVFSSVGYASQEFSIGANTDNVTVSLQAAAGNLSEVVVIGYGTARRRDVTGSISTVTSKDFVRGPITTPEQLILRKAACISN